MTIFWSVFWLVMGFALGGSFVSQSIAPINVFQWIASINMVGLTAATLFAWAVCIVSLASLCLLVLLIWTHRLYKRISPKFFRRSRMWLTFLAAIYAMYCAERLVFNFVIPVNIDQKFVLELVAYIIFWVLAPPIYFFVEYLAADNECINDLPSKSEANLKDVKVYAEYASKVWAGALALLVGLIALKGRK